MRFVDFKNGEMEVHAAARGDAADALGYLAATPLDDLAERGFSGVQATGALQCAVDLFFPFKQFDARRVLVHVDLHDATLKRRGASIAATNIAGTADIDGAQVVRADLHGQLLGGPVQMTARTPRSRAAMRTQLDFHGTSSGEVCARRWDSPAPLRSTVKRTGAGCCACRRSRRASVPCISLRASRDSSSGSLRRCTKPRTRPCRPRWICNGRRRP